MLRKFDPDVVRAGFVSNKFDPKPLPPKFGLLGSLLSILSLIFMTASAFWMVQQIDKPSVAFHRVMAPPSRGHKVHKHLPLHSVRIQANNTHELIAESVCFFPGIIENTTEMSPICLDPQDVDDRKQAPLWTRLPFYFTIWEAGLGAVFEFFLLIFGVPFQQGLNPFTQWVSRLRLLNLAFVSTAVFFFSVALSVPASNDVLLDFSMYALTGLAFALAPALFFGGLEAAGIDFMPMIEIGMQVAQFVFVISRAVVAGGSTATSVLAAAPVLQAIAFLVGTSTPMKSFAFHMISSGVGVCLYVTLMLAGTEEPDLVFAVQEVLLGPKSTHVTVFLAASGAAGWAIMMEVAPKVYHNFRSEISYYVWSLLYYVLVGNPSQPRPFRLSEVFPEGDAPKLITIKPYAQRHPFYMNPSLGLPAIAGGLPATIEKNSGSLVQEITALFNLMTLVDFFIPQANSTEPIQYKRRMSITNNGEDKYASQLFSMSDWMPFGFGLKSFPAMGRNLQKCPVNVIESYKEGELLSYLCQFGIGNTYLKRAVETDSYPFFKVIPANSEEKSGFVMDHRDLEAFEYKDDYEPYGGVAYFEVDENKNLSVKWLVTPRDNTKILKNRKNAAYRRAEAMISSSLYFAVICGKHLAEIHMTYNLLEVCAHNNFDVGLNTPRQADFNAHPLRVYLYVHLFSHGLAEELTTEHLTQRGSVFSQIFAMKYDSICHYLSKRYNDFEYASDEDFESRSAIMQPLNKSNRDLVSTNVPCSHQLEWELEYYKVFGDYAKRMAEAIYGTKQEGADKRIRDDHALQNFYYSMNCVFNKMPDRYEKFQTLEGVTRFMTDTTCHLVVRHQLYGTTNVAASMDPRLGSTQVPKDGGPIPVDEWRSTAYVGLATAYANFVHILDDPKNNPDLGNVRPMIDLFKDATPVTAEGHAAQKKLRKAMADSWTKMQADLRRLQTQWTGEKEYSYDDVPPHIDSNDLNYMYNRPLPAQLHTGPGY